MLLCATPASFQHPYVQAGIFHIKFKKPGGCRKYNQKQKFEIGKKKNTENRALRGRARQAERAQHGDRVGARRVGHGRLAQPPPLDPRQERTQALHRLQHRLWPRARSDISAHTLPGRAATAQPVKAWSYRACPKPRLQHGVWPRARRALRRRAAASVARWPASIDQRRMHTCKATLAAHPWRRWLPSTENHTLLGRRTCNRRPRSAWGRLQAAARQQGRAGPVACPASPSRHARWAVAGLV
jgi:hypothetical protein